MAKLKDSGWVVLVVLLICFGCAPLRQAPLIYASKASVGVDVSATTTEQPGVAINLGYKQIDAAYVPVAVAKDCDKDAAGSVEKCTADTYKVISVAGDNAIGDSKVAEKDVEAAKKRIQDFTQFINDQKEAQANCKSREAEWTILKTGVTDLNQKIKDTEEKIREAISAKDDIDKKKAEVNAQIAKDKEKSSRLQEDKKLGKPISEADESVLKTYSENEGRAKLLADQLAAKSKDVETLTNTKTSLENQKKEKESKIPAAKSAFELANTVASMADKTLQEKAKELPSIMNDIRLINPTTRHDAFSVFGSFDAKTKAGAESGGTPSVKGEASLAIGKVFSTGVAAQQLTEGMRRYYEGVGEAEVRKQVGVCLDKADALIAQFKLTQVQDSPDGKKNIADFMNSVTSRCMKDGASTVQTNKQGDKN